jgi:hypothetical protein
VRNPHSDDPYPGLYVGHYDGMIRNNVIIADIPQYDTGVELDQARLARVLHNTIIETTNATNSFSSIDYRFANTVVDIRNNLTRRITVRDGAQGTLTTNVVNTPGAWFADVGAGDAHLRSTAAAAIDQGSASVVAGLDLDHTTHDQGPPDIGADEYRR